jgi:hypothetical protein
MTYTTVALSKKFEHRYKFDAKILMLINNEFANTTVFLDTGCFNTMIPKQLANITGRPLGFKKSFTIGGNNMEAEAYSIDKLMIGDISLEKIVAFAGNYKGGYEDDIILGTNVVNNWEMIISKKHHTLKFREDPPENLPNRKNIYQNYFSKEGNYICVQDN